MSTQQDSLPVESASAPSTDDDQASNEPRCESVNPATGRRCTNTASGDGLCAMCRHAVTVVRVDEVPFDPAENPKPFSELDRPASEGDSA